MSTKNKKNKKKKLSSLILLLFLTIIMLSTATYAWFTANRTVKISDINVQISSKNGLQVSTNAADWKTLIANEDITGGYLAADGTTHNDKNMFTTTMNPVSTNGKIDADNAGQLAFYTGSVAANTTTGVFELTSSKITEAQKSADADFVVFDMFIKLDQASDIYYSLGSGVTAKSGSTDKGIKNASRIAFVKEGTVSDSSKSAADLISGTTGTTSDSDVVIIEPNYDQHTSYGINQYNLYYTDYGTYTLADTTNTDVTADPNVNSNAKVAYDGVKAPITTAIALANTNQTKNSSYFERVTTIGTNKAYTESDTTNRNYVSGTDTTANTYKLWSSFPAGVTRVRVYMWIEGQDIDCENNASGTDITYKVTLSLDGESA